MVVLPTGIVDTINLALWILSTWRKQNEIIKVLKSTYFTMLTVTINVEEEWLINNNFICGGMASSIT